jgi:hypothetical protein
MKYSIGVDFDNTLANYDDALYEAALASGFVRANTNRNKKRIRDEIRRLPNGEIKWQELQAFMYGKGIKNSKLFDGVKEFFGACRDSAVDVFVISHKTEFANMDQDQVNLRDAAINWMTSNRFFDPEGLGLSRGRVFFEPTRESKIERIKQLQCTHFIDDLDETFVEPSFPLHVKGILFAKERSQLNNVTTVASWKEIYDCFFAR